MPISPIAPHQPNQYSRASFCRWEARPTDDLLPVDIPLMHQVWSLDLREVPVGCNAWLLRFVHRMMARLSPLGHRTVKVIRRWKNNALGLRKWTSWTSGKEASWASNVEEVPRVMGA
jgi:hypothetical protein